MWLIFLPDGSVPVCLEYGQRKNCIFKPNIMNRVTSARPKNPFPFITPHTLASGRKVSLHEMKILS